MKATIRSFQEWTQEGSKLGYQVIATPVTLSWKKWINNFSSFAYAPIFLLYIFRWFLGQVVPLYLSKSGTLNFGGMMASGTRHNSAMLAKAWSQPPSMSLSLSSIWSNFPLSTIAGGTLPTAKCKGCGCGWNWGPSNVSGKGTPQTACPSVAYSRWGSKPARLWSRGASCVSPHGLRDMCMIRLGLLALNGYGCKVVDILIGSVCNIRRCIVRRQAIWWEGMLVLNLHKIRVTRTS